MSETTDAVFMLRHANEFTDIENTAIVYARGVWGIFGTSGKARTPGSPRRWRW